MSLVGPRPIRPVFFEQLCEEIPQYWQRLVVRPGLTGFAQLRMARDMSWAEKLAHDLEWLADRSVGLYLRLIVATALRRAAARRGRRRGDAPRRADPIAVCGICGIAGPRRRGGGRRTVRAMADALVHRGPDSEGVFADGPVALAARRLAIIDLARGDQPMRNEDGSVTVVQNGELYEHGRCRPTSSGAGTASRRTATPRCCRTSTRSAAPTSPSGLRGMFAIALWDARERRLLLARDPFGIKPLYYRVADGVLSFASELKALVRQPGFAGEIDLEALEAYLAFNSVPAPMSIYRDVRKLPPGHLLEARDGRVEVRRFARPAPVRGRRRAARGRRRARGRAARAVARLGPRAPRVRRAGRRVPVGRHRLVAARGAGGAGEPGRGVDVLDRLRGAVVRRARRGRAWSRRATGPTITSSCCAPDAAALLPEIAAAFDEPFADSSALPTYAVSRLAAEHVKVAISGEGGDELFGGYFTYVADVLAARSRGRAAAGARAAGRRAPAVVVAARLARVQGQALRARGARGRRSSAITAGRRSSRPRRGRRCWSRGAGRRASTRSSAWRARCAETAGAEPLARLQDVDIGTYLVDDLLVKTDRASMAHSLEVRVPFLDPVVAELALALPTSQKVLALAKKRLLRRAAVGLVPRAIVHGPKRGFSIPAAAWLRGELRPFARDVLSPDALRRDGFFRPADGDAAARRARGRPRGPLARAVGAAVLPAVAADRGGGGAGWVPRARRRL